MKSNYITVVLLTLVFTQTFAVADSTTDKIEIAQDILKTLKVETFSLEDQVKFYKAQNLLSEAIGRNKPVITTPENRKIFKGSSARTYKSRDPVTIKYDYFRKNTMQVMCLDAMNDAAREALQNCQTAGYVDCKTLSKSVVLQNEDSSVPGTLYAACGAEALVEGFLHDDQKTK